MSEEPFALTLHAPQPVAGDYDAIHAAVMETARGRWFLQEYARRNRNADTALLLAAIERIEAALHSQTAIPAPSHLASHPTSHPSETSHSADQGPSPAPDQSLASFTHQLHELRDAIALTKESLPATRPDGRIALRGVDFSRIAAGIGLATARIRSTAEQVQEAAWSLREQAEKEADPQRAALDKRSGELELQARDLSGACVKLDDMAAGATAIAVLLAEIEARLDGMIGALPMQTDAPAEAAAETASAAPEFQASYATPEPDEPQAPPAFQPAAAIPSGDAGFVIAQEPEPQLVAAQSQIAPEPAPEIAAEAVADAVAPQPQPDQTIAPPQGAAAPGNASWLDLLAPRVRSREAPDPAAAFNVQFNGETPPATELPNPAMREMGLPDSDPASPPAEYSQAAPLIEPDIAEAETGQAETGQAEASQAETGDAETGEAVIAVYQETVIVTEVIVETAIDQTADIAAPIPASELSDDPAAFLFESPPEAPAPQVPEPESAEPESAEPAVNGVEAHAANPAFQPIQIGRPGDPLAPIIALSDEEKIALFS